MSFGHLRSVVGVLSLLLVCLFLSACASGPLSRPVIVGASASAGYGCDTLGADGKSYLVDLEAVYEASVPGWHSTPVLLADASFLSRVREAQVQQVDGALRERASVLVALDYLFWSVYQHRDDAMSPEQVRRDREEMLEAALVQLDRFPGPIILGDIPDMRGAVGRMLAARNVPPPEQLAAFNQRIRAWAAGRPSQGAVVVCPVSTFVESINAGGAVATSFETLPPDAAAGLLQADRLHPTALGQAILLREGFAGLQARGVIPEGSFRTDLDDISSRLAAEARKADERRVPGLWSLLAVKGKIEAFQEASQAGDCARAGDLFDEVMQRLSRLKETPHTIADVYVGMSIMSYGVKCADAGAVVRKWRDRLAPMIDRPLPDPWPLDLWREFNRALGEDRLTFERALRLRREQPSLPEAYNDTLRHAAWVARYAEPASYLELLPDWKAELEKQIESIKRTEEFWLKYAKTDKWPAEVDRQHRMEMTFAKNEDERKRIEADRPSFEDPRRTIVRARGSDFDAIMELERALVLTGRDADAAYVRSRVDELGAPEEAAKARERVEATAREVLGKKRTTD